MTLQDILQQLVDDRGPIVLIIFVGLTLVEVSPLKIDPWGSLIRWIGKQLNKEVLNKIDDVEGRLDDHIKESNDSELRTRRATILDFSSSILRGVNYHKEKFDFMISECDSYEQYCAKNGIKNGVAEASISEIRQIYRDKLHRNDFLEKEEEVEDER